MPKVKQPKVDLSKASLLFTVIKDSERGMFRPAVYLVESGKVVDQKIGQQELLHHANQLVNVMMADWLTEYLTAPKEFFDGINF